jgi:hypothetical protein
LFVPTISFYSNGQYWHINDNGSLANQQGMESQVCCNKDKEAIKMLEKMVMTTKVKVVVENLIVNVVIITIKVVM